MTAKYVKPLYVFLIACFLIYAPSSHAAPKLTPGSIRDTYNTEICSSDWKSGTFSFGGTDITFYKHLVNGGESMTLPTLDGECILVVTEGQVTVTTGTDGESRPLSVKECLFTDMKGMCTLPVKQFLSVILLTGVPVSEKL